MTARFIHPTAEVSDECHIGDGTSIWHQVQIVGPVEIGANCSIGKGAYLCGETKLGNQVKIQNYANIFGARIENDAFIGPFVVVLHDPTPRSTNENGTLKQVGDFTRRLPVIEEGASIGAQSTILPGVRIGAYAMVSVGSIVHKDVAPYTLIAGNPARLLGYVCRCGERVQCVGKLFVCAVCGHMYDSTPSGLEIRPRHPPNPL